MRVRTPDGDALGLAHPDVVRNGIVIVFAELAVGHLSNGSLHRIAKIDFALVNLEAVNTILEDLVQLGVPPRACLGVGEVGHQSLAFPPFRGRVVVDAIAQTVSLIVVGCLLLRRVLACRVHASRQPQNHFHTIVVERPNHLFGMRVALTVPVEVVVRLCPGAVDDDAVDGNLVGSIFSIEPLCAQLGVDTVFPDDMSQRPRGH